MVCVYVCVLTQEYNNGSFIPGHECVLRRGVIFISYDTGERNSG